MGTVSLCMIVRDEEAVLGRCLDRVRGRVDEIILADTGSRDRTREIGAAYGARVYDFPWRDDFAAARNFAFSKGTMDYLLWLDADDLLPEATAGALRSLADGKSDLVMLPYHTGFDSRGRCSFWCWRERLVRREAGFRWVGAVHECIVPAGRVTRADFPVEHRPGEKPLSDRNLRILQRQLEQTGTLPPRERYYYGRELLEQGQKAEAAAQFAAFLRDPGGWGPDRTAARRLLAGCTEDPERRLELLLAGLGEGPPEPGLCCDLGRELLEQGRPEAAEFWFRTAMTRPEPPGFVCEEERRLLPAIWLTVCRDRLGDRPGALGWHRLARQLAPDHPAVLHNDRYFGL